MRWTLVFCLALTLAPHFASAQAAQYQGRAYISRVLGERLLQSGDFDLSRYFKSSQGRASDAVLNLLGGVASVGGEFKFVNGRPNALNVLLWETTIHGLAQDISHSCYTSSDLQWSVAFRSTLDKICLWPAANATNATALEELWLALMSYDAPREEFEAWRDFFLQSSYPHRPANEAVEAMVFAAYFNPHFLLRK